MSIHPSLTISEKDKKARSVLKRIERIRQMHEKGSWKQGDSVYGLPKIKSLRIKIKKEKVEKAATATEAGAPEAATAGAKDAKAAGAKDAKAATSKAAPKAAAKAAPKA
jgi:small basic protein (TIGR04137 family)